MQFKVVLIKSFIKLLSLTYLAFFHFVLKTQGEQTNMSGLFPVNATGLDRLGQILVHPIRGLMINTRMSLLERSLKLLGHLVLKITATYFFSVSRVAKRNL